MTRPAPYVLPDLPYDVSALEPHLSATLLALHHDTHHAAYVKGANQTLERLGDAGSADIGALERTLAFHLGGHLLHSAFWQCLSPDGRSEPEGDLAAAIDQQFGSFERFASQFADSLTTIQGSGWAILAWEPTGQRLVIEQVHDHQGSHVVASQPVLVADGWEHAYYLDYRSDKSAWAAAFFALADWSAASRRFDTACSLSRSR